MSIKINAGNIVGGSVSGNNGDVTITTKGSVSGLSVAGGRVTINGREVPNGLIEVPAPKLPPMPRLVDEQMLAQSLLLSTQSIIRKIKEVRAAPEQDPEAQLTLREIRAEVADCVELAARLQAALRKVTP